MAGLAARAPGRSNRSSTIWAARAALILVGVVVPLMALEGFLRVAGAVVPGDYQTTSFLEAHPEFGRRNRPGAGWKRTAEFTSWIEINSKGLRGPEADYAKPPGEYRVLVLGDSFTFAEQVNQHETFTQLLEDRLNGSSGLKTVRVLNAGSNGWATANELVFLAEEGVKFSPDLVIAALYAGNDVSDNYERVAVLRDAERADLALRGADAFEGPRRVLRQSMLYTVVETGVLAKLPWWQAAGESEGAVRKSPRTREEAEEAWKITATLLHRMRQVSESRGANFVTLVIPSATEVATRDRSRNDIDPEEQDEPGDETPPGFEDVHGRLNAMAAELDLLMLDLLPTFQRQAVRSRQRLFFRQNAHFTAAGHELAAEELYDFLVRRRLAPVG
jgi:lysophospholipase L1-like esterase